MAVTVTAIAAPAGSNAFATLKIWDITATADADTTTGNIAHGLGATPLFFSLTPLLQVPASLSLWALTTKDATNLVLTKATTASSGNAGAQIRLCAWLPNSIAA